MFPILCPESWSPAGDPAPLTPEQEMLMALSAPRQPSVWRDAMTVLSMAGGALGAYHGYRRNGGSLGWAAWWSLMGGMFPMFTVPVALAQGYGDPSRGK